MRPKDRNLDGSQDYDLEGDVFDEREWEIFEKIRDWRRHQRGVHLFIRHPLQVISQKPITVLIISAPVALLLFISAVIRLTSSCNGTISSTTMIDDIAVLSIMVAIVPLAVLDLKETHRVSNIEESLPNFFRDVAGMNDSGMTLPHAVHVAAEGGYGALEPYIRRLDLEISWGVPFVEAINRFGRSLNTPLARRSADLIAHAASAGGNTSETLRAAAQDAYEHYDLKSERRRDMTIYAAIIVMAFFVFLLVVGVLSSTLLPVMAETGGPTTGSGQSFMSGVDLCLYHRLFFHSALIQGFFSGLVAGIMSEGRVIAGLKYSIVMIPIAWVAFRLLI